MNCYSTILKGIKTILELGFGMNKKCQNNNNRKITRFKMSSFKKNDFSNIMFKYESHEKIKDWRKRNKDKK